MPQSRIVGGATSHSEIFTLNVILITLDFEIVTAKDAMNQPALPASKAPSTHWVQTEREAHEAWSALIAKSPTAARLMHLLVARVGDHNAVVVSQPTLARLLGCHANTVANAIRLLSTDRWIEVRRVGGSGTTNAYVLNDRVAWVGPRDGIRYSLFSASVIASDEEQPDRDQIGHQDPLRRLPRVGELQLPSGDGLLPPSQPFFDGMEPDLPAFGREKSPDLDHNR